MSRLGPAEFEMRTAMAANLQAVEKFCAEFRLKHKALLECVDGFAGELLLREALTNAVLHGCDMDANRGIRCAVRLKGRRLLIFVQDDGDGFDWRGASEKAADLSDCSGRGIEILRVYADHVRYNDRGNVVAMIKRLCC
jgi:serine/threonine-protein kinase RsbW